LGEFPADWKKANATSVFKKGEEKAGDCSQVGLTSIWKDDGTDNPVKHF